MCKISQIYLCWALSHPFGIEQLTMHLQPWVSVKLSRCHPSSLMVHSTENWSIYLSHVLNQQEDEKIPRDRAISEVIPLPARCSWMWVSLGDKRGVGFWVYSSLPVRDMEPRVNIDCQPSVSLAGHHLTFQTSVHLTWTTRERVTPTPTHKHNCMHTHSYMHQSKSATWNRQARIRGLYD